MRRLDDDSDNEECIDVDEEGEDTGSDFSEDAVEATAAEIKQQQLPEYRRALVGAARVHIHTTCG